MFEGCWNLEELNISNFNTTNVTNMHGMLKQCQIYKRLNLTNFITNSIIHMSYMFGQCNELTELIISNFNTENVRKCSRYAKYVFNVYKINKVRTFQF